MRKLDDLAFKIKSHARPDKIPNINRIEAAIVLFFFRSKYLINTYIYYFGNDFAAHRLGIAARWSIVLLFEKCQPDVEFVVLSNLAVTG